jgi:hypothetical protein
MNTWSSIGCSQQSIITWKYLYNQKNSSTKIQQDESWKKRAKRNELGENFTHHDERAESLKLNYVVPLKFMRKNDKRKFDSWASLACEKFSLCFQPSAMTLFYCSHVSKLFYDNASPISAYLSIQINVYLPTSKLRWIFAAVLERRRHKSTWNETKKKR